MEIYTIVISVMSIALLGLCIYLFLSCKKSRNNCSKMQNQINNIEKELSNSLKHRTILKNTVKTLMENNSDLKKKNQIVEVKLKATQEKLDVIKKFIKDMKES